MNLTYLIGLFFLSALIIEYYSYQTIKTLTQNNKTRRIWRFFSLSSFLLILIGSILVDRNDKESVQFLMSFSMLVYVPKLVLSITLIVEDLFRGLSFIIKKTISPKKDKTHLPERRKAISTIGLGLASIPFLGIIEGIIWGKYDFRVRKITLSFPNLPENFIGYKIVQTSDMHLGSFDIKDMNKIAKGIDLINEQNADLFLFTGDSVNNLAEEMLPWLPLLKTIKAKEGKYSILGNHDYGIYMFGDDRASQKKNIEKLEKLHSSINWTLLRNESIQIKKGNQYFNLIGVENWGTGHFPKFGDLEKATQNIHSDEFNILMSHDPTHFDAKVKEFTKKIHLTLSGHTHGMQFGIEIPGVIKWSPIKYKYPKWAGLYESLGRYLYVNRGFGYIGFSGRVGIWPEITVIELQKG